MHGGQKRAAVVLHTTVASWWRDGDESRQVFALTSQAVTDPGANTGPYQIRLAGVQSQQRFTVSHPLGMHGADDTHPVSLPGKIRQQLT